MYSRMSWEATSGLMPIGAQHGRGRLIRPKRASSANRIRRRRPRLAEARLAFLTACGKPLASIVGSHRGTPDIAAVANPVTGVWVYDIGWVIVGGTSVASPLLAGIANAMGTFRGNTASELTAIYNAKAAGPTTAFTIPVAIAALMRATRLHQPGISALAWGQ